jgi:hypothetical protein
VEAVVEPKAVGECKPDSFAMMRHGNLVKSIELDDFLTLLGSILDREGIKEFIETVKTMRQECKFKQISVQFSPISSNSSGIQMTVDDSWNKKKSYQKDKDLMATTLTIERKKNKPKTIHCVSFIFELEDLKKLLKKALDQVKEAAEQKDLDAFANSLCTGFKLISFLLAPFLFQGTLEPKAGGLVLEPMEDLLIFF